MRNAILILGLALALAFAADVIDLRDSPRLHILESDAERQGGDVRLPVVLSPLNGTSLSLILPATGFYERNVVILRIRGSARLSLENTERIIGRGQDYCRENGNGTASCRVPWRRHARDPLSLRLKAEGGEAVVEKFSVSALSETRVSQLGLIDFNIIGGLVLGAIPLIWLLHSRYRESQWLIIAIATVALTLVHPAFTAVLLLFLSGMFWAGRSMLSRGAKSLKLLVSLMISALGFLVLFKFGQPALARIFANVGGFNLALPLGVSYFIVRLIDTQIKWYRGQLADIGFREYLCFMIFPPTLAAGPIETAQRFRDNRLSAITKRDVAEGASRVAWGVFQKIIIADFVAGKFVDGNFFRVGLDPETAPVEQVAALLFGNLLFAYLDFSAYSHIAIGLGRLYGYRIVENFNFPVLQGNIRDYWRTWHISLTDFAKRNVYLPVALATRNNYVPIYATMIAIAAWHNPGLSWFFWAIHHATGLSLITYLDSKRKNPPSRAWLVYARPVRTMLTVGFVAMGHSFVLYDDVETAVGCYLRAWSLLAGNW